MDAFDYVVVQAGGKGTRLKKYTRNKPKALVPIDNKPLILHLFDKYKGKKFIVIGDYKEDVLRKYLNIYPKEKRVKFIFVSADGETGTCAGIRKALAYIPEGARFALTWCDLLLSKETSVPDFDGNLIGTTDSFSCRWSFRDGAPVEERSDRGGIAGFFVFKDKSVLSDVPTSGEFVRWLSKSEIALKSFDLKGAKEFGLYEDIPSIEGGKCRPFNSIEIDGEGHIVKKGIDAQGQKLAKDECAWYEAVKGFEGIPIPKIYESGPPIVMEKVDGKNVFAYDLTRDQKLEILKKIVDSLKHLHSCGSAPADPFSTRKNYYDKTISRISEVRDLIPHAYDRYITINGKRCRNVFYCMEELEKRLYEISNKPFAIIHGDCTFSNMILRNGTDPVFIDPRGYFGDTKIYGDPAYDWAKLYYSIAGNYDKFNLRKFDLTIGDDIKLRIESNGWEDMEGEYLKLISDEINERDLRLLHAVIWLSLTTYAWEDYDSICAAFYNGLWYLEDAMGDYFDGIMETVNKSVDSIDRDVFYRLVNDVCCTLSNGRKVVITGLGKNAPICEKFVGTMLSLGLNSTFLHTNTAVHGDLGTIRKGDLIMILSKSGETAESKRLLDYVRDNLGRDNSIWTMTFEKDSYLANNSPNTLTIPLDHEGDDWNKVPNNSTTVYLIVLQALAMNVAKRKGVTYDDFILNHPGGAIGDAAKKQ